MLGDVARFFWRWATEETTEEKGSRGPLLQYEIIPDLVSECTQESGLFVEYKGRQIAMGAVFPAKQAQYAPKVGFVFVCLLLVQSNTDANVHCR